MPTHQYSITTTWTGNTGEGTARYDSYGRAHTIEAEGKPAIMCSSDPSFKGDRTRYNPEEMLLASLSSCHMLWYLHLCSAADIIVTAYEDQAEGKMVENASGDGRFTEVVLRPNVTVKEESMIEKAIAIHHKANKMCFIANSVNFPVIHRPSCKCT